MKWLQLAVTDMCGQEAIVTNSGTDYEVERVWEDSQDTCTSEPIVVTSAKLINMFIVSM